MKRLIVTMLACLSIAGCKAKEDVSLNDKRGENAGTASLFINGKKYNSIFTSAEYSKELADRISLVLLVYKKDCIAQILTLSHIDPGQREQQIATGNYKDGCIGYFVLQHADTVKCRYTTDGTALNNIYIEEYNKDNGRIKGYFKMTFCKDYERLPGTKTLTDTLVFTKGNFDVQVKLRTCIGCL